MGAQGTRKDSDNQSKAKYSKKKKNKYKKKNGKSNGAKVHRFIGKREKMKGHVFQLKSESRSILQFTKTQEQLVRYATVEFKKCEAIKKMIKTLQESVIPEPTESTTIKSDKVRERVFEEKIKSYVQKQESYEENKSKLWDVIWDQSSDALQHKLESLTGYEKILEEVDCATLLQSIKKLMYQQQGSDYLPITIYEAKLNSLICRQGKKESLNRYYTRLKGHIEVLSFNDSTHGDDIGMVHFVMREKGVTIKPKLHLPGNTTFESYRIEAQERFWATVFIMNTCSERFGSLKKDLANAYAKGNMEYPTSLTSAYELALKHKEIDDIQQNSSQTICSLTDDDSVQETTSTNNKGGEVDSDTLQFMEGLSFANAKVECYNCGEPDHISPNCPHPKKKQQEGEKSRKKQITMATMGVNHEPDMSEHESDAESTDLGGCDFLLNTVGKFQPITSTQQIVLTNNELVPKNWILLDTQSTIHIFKNKEMLQEVKATDTGVRCYCNSGYQDTDKAGVFPGVKEDVYYNATSLANILSFSLLSEQYRITCDTARENSFTVHDINGINMKFRKSDNGLYYHHYQPPKNDTKIITTSPHHTTIVPPKSTSTPQHTNDNDNIILVQTVLQEMEGFTKREIKKAKTARRLYILLGRPSYRDFGNIVKWGLLKNCPVTFQDVVNSWKIFGQDLGAVRGKTVRQQPPPVTKDDIVPIPQELLFQLQDVTLCADLMFLDKMVMLTIYSRRVGFTTVDFIKSQKKDTIYTALKKVLTLYKSRGIPVKYLFTDRQFLPLKDKLLQDDDVILNVTSATEHVPDVEKNIRSLKERSRSASSVLPYDILPKLMKMAKVKLCAFWMNLFPREGSITSIYSPRMLLLGEMADFDKICKVPFGAYCEVFDNTQPSNTDTPRTSPAIALCPENNLQESYYFLNLNTWKIVSRRQWKELPLTEEIIKMVNDKGREEIGLKSGEPIPEQYLFQYLDGTVIGVDDPTQSVEEEIPLSQVDDNSVHDHEGENVDVNTFAQNYRTTADDDELDNEDNGESDTNEYENENINIAQAEGEVEPEEIGPETVDNNSEEPNEEAAIADMLEMINEGEQLLASTEDNSRNSGGYNLRSNARTDYSFRFGMQEGNNPEGANLSTIHQQRTKNKDFNLKTYLDKKKDNPIVKPRDGFGYKYGYASQVLMLQYSAKQGLKKFGQRAIDAIKAEFYQLVHTMEVFIPLQYKDLTRDQRRKALKAITLIDYKRSGKVKGRTVANGSVQRYYILPEDACSPTVTTEAVFLTSVLNAKENRVVAVCDVSGAFLQAFMDEFVVVVFEDQMVELLIETEPNYEQFVYTTSKGKKLLFVQLRKAMYGCMRAARLWWEDLSTYLTKELGLTINPYDNCVANKEIDGQQCTIIWHVDDLKISHKEEKVVRDIIDKLETKYGKMSVNISDKLTYVGMDFEYRGDGTVTVSMISYIDDAIAEYTGKMKDNAVTPAGLHLFEVNETTETLDEERAKLFHRIVAMLLFVAKRARPDIQVAIAFMSTRTTK